MATIALLGTLDTKLDEFLRLRDLLISAGASNVVLIDAGRKDTEQSNITISHSELLRHGEEAGFAEQKPNLDSAPRGEIVDYMTRCAEQCVRKLYDDGRIQGIVSAGGTGGTSLATSVMRALPIGFPKVMVSTVGTGDIGPFVAEVDIFMVYSIVDIAGWNGMLETVFSNAAGAVVGMAQAAQKRNRDRVRVENGTPYAMRKRRVGITMFGVTTPCVDMIREELTRDGKIEVWVFHATGHGGKALEHAISGGKLDAVIDLTTTEICDYLLGGIMSAGARRLEAGLKLGMPYVISVGACDMVNFGPKSTVPEKYRDRKWYEHNSAATLMRTTPEECRKIGNFIAEKIMVSARTPARVRIVLPGDGVSLISANGQPFHDPEADRALFDAISAFKGNPPDLKIIRRSEAINSEPFAKAVVQALNDISS